MSFSVKGGTAINSTTHITVGALTGGLWVAYAISRREFTLGFGSYSVNPLVITVAAAIGSIAPDIDMPRSVSGRFFRQILRLFLVISAAILTLLLIAPYTNTQAGYIGDAIRASGVIGESYPIVLAVISLALLYIIENAHHRGITHTMFLLAVIAIPAVFMIMRHPYFPGDATALSAQIGFLSGWCSHLVIDTFNKPGVLWVWPLTNRHISVMRVKNGTTEERIFRYFTVVLFAIAYTAIIAKCAVNPLLSDRSG